MITEESGINSGILPYMDLEVGITYLSEDGNRAFVAINSKEVVSWANTWVLQEPIEVLIPSYDMPSGALIRCWATTPGALDDLTRTFIRPAEYRDTTKRPYKNYRNSGKMPGEDSNSLLAWMLQRTHKISVRLHHDQD